MNHDDKQSVALWRLGVLGPLASARLEHGDRRRYFDEAAARTHERPDGTRVQLSTRTIEAWYYAYRRGGGFQALFPQDREDRGKSRAIGAEIAEHILRAKRERPRRSIRRIIRMLERARIVRAGELHRSTVHRLLAAHGASARPPRGPGVERRSFLHEHAGDLWVGDALHGPLVIAPDGSLRKAYLLSQIDGATRYMPHSYFALSESAVDQEYGFRQAIAKHGPPRVYYVDLGSAYRADSLVLICAELGIHLLHTGVQDCEAKGVIERWHRTWREEVGDELPDDPLSLAELNAKHWAWLGAEYHARKHDTTGKVPREHWLAEIPYLRTLPRHKNLDEVFLHRERRFVRKDGTVRFRGGLLEVRPELVGREVELRFDPRDDAARPRVFVEDRFACDTVPLDRLRNASRRRRRLRGEAPPDVEPSGLDPLALIEAEHYERVRPVGAPPRPPVVSARLTRRTDPMYRQRFGLTGHPLPKDAQGKTFFDKSPGYKKLERAFRQLVEDPGLGVVTADAGVGKTAAIRNLCAQLPRPDYLVLYLCDTAVAPLDLYRTLATELGVRPSHRRAELWTDIKKALMHMVDQRGTSPVIIVDEAQHLSDDFLIDLSGFLNFAFDSRDLLTMWLVGLPPLARHLRMQQHAPLAMRVVHQVHLEPLDRALMSAMVEHGLKAAGATQSLLADPARELLFRASRGVPRLASNLLRGALREAHERNQTFIDDHTMEAAIDASPSAQAVTG